MASKKMLKRRCVLTLESSKDSPESEVAFAERVRELMFTLEYTHDFKCIDLNGANGTLNDWVNVLPTVDNEEGK